MTRRHSVALALSSLLSLGLVTARTHTGRESEAEQLMGKINVVQPVRVTRHNAYGTSICRTTPTLAPTLRKVERGRAFTGLCATVPAAPSQGASNPYDSAGAGHHPRLLRRPTRFARGQVTASHHPGYPRAHVHFQRVPLLQVSVVADLSSTRAHLSAIGRISVSFL